MSIILKALKKAEAAASKSRSPQLRVSMAGGRDLRLRLIAGVCAAALVFFFIGYLIKGKPAAQRPAPAPPPSPNALAPQPRPPAGMAGASRLNSAAIDHIKAGRLAEAEKLLNDAVKAHPNNAELYNHLGLVLKKQGRLDEAVGAYRKAIELEPGYHIAMNNLAVTLEAIGDNAGARRLYEGILAEEPAIAGVHLNYALMLERDGKLDEAESHYHTFLTLSDDETLKGLVKRRLRSLR